MAGIGDTKQPDDLKLHLERIVVADDERVVVPEGETAEQAMRRTSAKLPRKLRARADEALSELRTQVPGLTAAETKKLLATRAGRDALNHGKSALARVDDHLQSVTGERNPIIAKKYGVYGDNPDSFGGVLRALDASSGENARLGELAEDADERDLLFTPLVAHEVEQARGELETILGARLDTRAGLSRAVTVKDKTLDEINRVISAVRSHLYANLPDRKQDDDLRLYGFRPLEPSGAARPRHAGDPTAPAVER